MPANEVVLFKRHADGNVGTWSIWNEANVIHMLTRRTFSSAGTLALEEVPHGLAGRTLDDQILLRMAARIRSKLDNGYKVTEAEALHGTSPTNQLELLLPMLAQSKTEYLSNATAIYVQPKLDGMRMIAHMDSLGLVTLYSRKGKLIETVPHIADELANVMEPGTYWDGELYAHGTNLQQIMSWAKRTQADTARLQYHVFDMIEDTDFVTRYYDMATRVAGNNCQRIVPVDTTELDSENDLPNLLSTARANGYEGLILRDGNAGYEPGKRSKSLIKVKSFMDSEFPVVDITTGRQGEPVLVCRAPNGETFRVTAPGTHANRRVIAANAADWVGHMVTVKYAGLTAYGIPFHPVCLGKR